MLLDRVIHFGETLGDQVKGRSPKKLKSLIEVPNVVHVKVHVLSLNMILDRTRDDERKSGYLGGGRIVKKSKESFCEQPKIFIRGCLSMSSESTCF